MSGLTLKRQPGFKQTHASAKLHRNRGFPANASLRVLSSSDDAGSSEEWGQVLDLRGDQRIVKIEARGGEYAEGLKV